VVRRSRHRRNRWTNQRSREFETRGSGTLFHQPGTVPPKRGLARDCWRRLAGFSRSVVGGVTGDGVLRNTFYTPVTSSPTTKPLRGARNARLPQAIARGRASYIYTHLHPPLVYRGSIWHGMQRLSVYKVQAPQRPVYSILKPLSAATTDDYDVTRSTPQPKPQDYRRDGKRCCSGRLPAAGDRPLLRQTIIRITYRSARPATRHHFFSK